MCVCVGVAVAVAVDRLGLSNGPRSNGPEQSNTHSAPLSFPYVYLWVWLWTFSLSNREQSNTQSVHPLCVSVGVAVGR